MMAFTELLDWTSLRSIIIFLVVFLLGLYWIRRPRNLPPGPLGLPFVGSMLALRNAPAHVVFTDWSKIYGDVISVRMGFKLFIVLNDIGCIKRALHNQADVFSYRILSNTAKMTGVKGSFVYENGAIWKERRRFGLGALRSFGMGKRSAECSVNDESRYLLDCFAAQEGKAFDPTDLVHNAVSNIICKICFGYRFDYTDEKFAQLLARIRKQFVFTATCLGNSIPWLIHTPLYSHAKENIRSLKKSIDEIIQEHRESYDKNDIRDIIDMHFAEVEKRENSGKDNDLFGKDNFNDETLGRGLYDFFVAGSDTSSNSLLWFLMYMALHQDIQKKVQSEIDDVIGGSRQPSSSDCPNLPYTNAAILEIQRIRPVGPLGLPRHTKDQTTLDGHTLPKHTCVLINVWAVHHDPATWTEPEKYNPSRFLSVDRKSVIHHNSLIPFGTGRRSCLGENLAKMEMFLFSVNILQQFTVTFPEGKPTPSQDGVAGLVLSPGPFELCFTRRS
ncbi:cytochrome P450 2U1-like [Asterias amurensis]|uniref:cytochrome P450 2U1-like n=1 Tax=Asterias amurensis TaxID=7602 RepID=UPI003AB8DA33